MRIATQTQPKRPAENVIPMINVVFLLLVFFLITARIAPPMPVEIEAPEAEGHTLDAGPDTLILAPDGTAHYQGETGAAAMALLAGRAGETALTLRADKTMEAARLADVLRQVNAIAPGPVELVVEN